MYVWEVPHIHGRAVHVVWDGVAMIAEYINAVGDSWLLIPMISTIGIDSRVSLYYLCHNKLMNTTQHLTAIVAHDIILYSGKLSREKTLVNFAVLWQNMKVFSVKFGAWHPLAWQSKQSTKVFSMKIVSFTNSRKFSPSKVSRYTVL